MNLLKKVDLQNAIVAEKEKFSKDTLNVSLGEIINLHKNGELVIPLEAQQLFWWTEARRTGFIECLLLSLFVPPICVLEDANGVWQILDGLQRIITVITFFGELNASSIKQADQGTIKQLNKWKLGEGVLIKHLAGFDIDTLPQILKIQLKRTICEVKIIRVQNYSTQLPLLKRLIK